MKTIGIDCRFAASASGLGRYTRNIVAELLRRDDPAKYVLFVRSQREDWTSVIDNIADCRLQIADAPHYSLREQTIFPWLLARSGIDLLFSPHFNVPLPCPVSFVATIHDLILHDVKGVSAFKHMAYRMQMRSTVQRSRALIAVSHFTALQIGGAYGPSAHRKTIVIGEGVEDRFRPVSESALHTVRERYALPSSFFLYVGSDKPHKNVETLVQAFAASGSSLSLVLLMPGNGYRALPPRVQRLALVAEEDLPALYCAAECFVTASLHEGYCLPVAEALSCGCPVIASNRTAIPQTAAGAATLVEPTVDALTAALRSHPNRPVHFSAPRWCDAARSTIDVLLRCS